jgi:hypothetical protein
MEALAEYDTKLADYHQSMAVWNSMSNEERVVAHIRAENESISGYSSFVGALFGAIAWYILAKTFNIDALFGLGILVVFIAAFTAIVPIRILVGRLTRLIFRSFFYFIFFWIAGAIISFWSPLLKQNSFILTLTLAIAMLVLSIFLEISGRHHASGAPVMPIKPNP